MEEQMQFFCFDWNKKLKCDRLGVGAVIGGLPPVCGLEQVLRWISGVFAGDAIDSIPDFAHQSYLNYTA